MIPIVRQNRVSDAAAQRVTRPNVCSPIHATCVALITLVALCTVAQPAVAADATVFTDGVRLQDEIVLVDFRSVGGCCTLDSLNEGTRIRTYGITDDSGDRRWMPVDVDILRDADPSIATLVFVHGNRVTRGEACREGLSVYRRVVRQSDSDAPIRFVIFSWPSSKVGGPLKDVRIKAARTRPAALQLAWLVDQLPAETHVSLVGFSFGARIITGALHVLGGGSLNGRTLTDRLHPERAPVNAVLIVAALHADWLAPGHYHGLAMTQVDQMLLLNSCQDRAMKYYRFVTKRGNPQALGLRGPTCIDAAGASKITERDLGRYVGSEHNVFCYMSAPGVSNQLWESAAQEPATHDL